MADSKKVVKVEQSRDTDSTTQQSIGQLASTKPSKEAKEYKVEQRKEEKPDDWSML